MAGLALAGPTLAGAAIRISSAPIVFYMIGGFWLLQALAVAMLIGRADRGKSKDVTAPEARLRDLAANPQLIGASLLEGLSLTTVGVFSTFVSIIAIRKFGLTAPHIALLISLQGVGYASTLIWGAGIAARISEFRLRIWGSAGAALTFLVFALAPSFLIMAPAALFLGLSLGLLGPDQFIPADRTELEPRLYRGFLRFRHERLRFHRDAGRRLRLPNTGTSGHTLAGARAPCGSHIADVFQVFPV